MISHQKVKTILTEAREHYENDSFASTCNEATDTAR